MSKRINIMLPDQTVKVLDKVAVKGDRTVSFPRLSCTMSKPRARPTFGNGLSKEL